MSTIRHVPGPVSNSHEWVERIKDRLYLGSVEIEGDDCWFRCFDVILDFGGRCGPSNESWMPYIFIYGGKGASKDRATGSDTTDYDPITKINAHGRNIEAHRLAMNFGKEIVEQYWWQLLSQKERGETVWSGNLSGVK